MALINKVSAVLNEQDASDIFTAINLIQSKLPFLINLSPEEVKALPKFGDKSVAFVNKALELVKQDSSFMPRSFNVDEFRKDVELYAGLYSILLPFRSLMEKFENTYYEVGAESYAASLMVYSNAKLNGIAFNVPGAALDDLSKRFMQKSSVQEEKKTE